LNLLNIRVFSEFCKRLDAPLAIKSIARWLFNSFGCCVNLFRRVLIYAACR
jgi:hypothetical protein